MSPKPEEIRRILSINIKKRRKDMGISQEKLAELAGLSAQTVNDIEGCRMWVSDKTIAKLCGALRIEAYQLLLPYLSERPLVNKESTALELLDSLRQNIIDNIDLQFSEVLRSGAINSTTGPGPVGAGPSNQTFSGSSM
jgi:transcriptional regulator with XRE-family HTH domain